MNSCRFWLFWLLLCCMSTAMAAPYIESHPGNPGYMRVVNPDPIAYWCWADTGEGYNEGPLYPRSYSLWFRGIYRWGCQPL